MEEDLEDSAETSAQSDDETGSEPSRCPVHICLRL